ncbi:SocA family protein [Stenotrophomonas maltophilia]|uniref:SocA family protein n=1 Tax=Stenotrophomonas maltophilia group TaxID=995085 RepID=UPI001013D5DE|nr:SocA family protein [Stenotrophomonas maltophilia]NNH47557.1 SocA family protein [Stenotrophomonas maltophilia]
MSQNMALAIVERILFFLNGKRARIQNGRIGLTRVVSMDRMEVMLAALASGAHEEFSPVQLQKLMFLIDRNIGSAIGGPFFDFKPYDYGPFDVGVYNEFSVLSELEMGDCHGDGKGRRYRLNDEGRARAQEVIAKLQPEVRDYMKSIAEFVQKVSFTTLVSSIYKHYPEMKVNSVFRG